MLAKKELPLYCEVGCGLALPVSYGFTAPLNEGRAVLRGRDAFFGMRVTNTVFQGNHSTKPVWLARIAGAVPVHA